ncbi:MAG: thioesterase family protein [bacterium]|nr:thioesterase family protein [bacterium]
MTDALFIPDGDHYLPTELTRGGWSDLAQHGSPPSGLLAVAIERVSTVAPMQVARFTIDLFRPVPLEPLRVETHVLRDGKRIQVVEGILLHGDLEVGRATALKIRTTEVALPEVEQEPWEQPPPPEQGASIADSWTFGSGSLPRFHLDAVEIRSIDDSFLQPGPGVSWFRLNQPVIAGQEPTPFVRLATLADLANGNSQALDPEAYLYVNPDITLYAHRLPEGEWVGMKSAAHQHRSGIGLADTRVFDETGPLGRINQAQLLDRRRGG